MTLPVQAFHAFDGGGAFRRAHGFTRACASESAGRRCDGHAAFAAGTALIPGPASRRIYSPVRSDRSWPPL